MRSRSVVIITILLIALAVLGVWGYFWFQDRNTPTSGSGQQTNTNTSQTTPSGAQQGPQNGKPGTQPSSPYSVFVFFSKRPQSDDDPSRVFPVRRTSPDLGVGTYAITQLLAGPTESESSAGYFSTANLRSGSISNCGGKDFILTIDSGTATLKFCRIFDHRGSVSDGQAESEINATLKQFSSIQKVVILNYNGDCEFNLSGQNLCLQ